jgi:NADH-quinone oxidoreductase subunit G
LLPIGTFAETAGTFINCEGVWQSFIGVAKPVGEARPAWKVLRVLGNLLDAENFDYQSSDEIRIEFAGLVGDPQFDSMRSGKAVYASNNGADAADREIDTPIYQVDGLVRRATALQLTPEARRARDRSA